MDTQTTPFLASSVAKDEIEDPTLYHEPEPDASPYSTTRTSHSHRKRRVLRAAFHLTAYLLAIWGLASTFLLLRPFSSHSPTLDPTHDVYRPWTLPPLLNHCYCGTSVPEALSLNCTYDTLATAWLPAYCRDPDLTAEFDQSGPGANGSWPYFADENGTIPIPVSKLGFQKTFWASRQWHITHCIFYWMKYTRMRTTGVVMEERFDAMIHVRHCAGMLLKTGKDSGALIEVPVMMNSSMAAHLAAGHGHGHDHES